MKKIAGFLATIILMLSLTCLFSSCSDEIKITFVQEGQKNIVKTVSVGESLTDIPIPVSKDGYSITWDVNNFSNIQESLIVNAIVTPNNYTIYYEVSDFVSITAKSQTVTFNANTVLYRPTHVFSTVEFVCWKIKDKDVVFSDGVYNIVGDVTLVADWHIVDDSEWSPQG